MLLILVAINFIAGQVKQRVDLTAEHAYTLSPGTKAILAKLDTPVQIRFYASQSADGMPVFLKTYAQQVDDLLGEYRQEFARLDSNPEARSRAGFRRGRFRQARRRRAATSLEWRAGLSRSERQPARPERSDPVSQPGARAPPGIRHLARHRARHDAGKPVIGVLSSLPVMGTGAMMPMQQQGEPPWVLIEELKRDFDVKEIEPNATTIPDNVKVLLVIHRKGITQLRCRSGWWSHSARFP